MGANAPHSAGLGSVRRFPDSQPGLWYAAEALDSDELRTRARARALFVLAQNYLRDLMKAASGALDGLPWAAALLHPDRWLLWLGVLFIFCVYYFPTGIVGRLRARGG